MISTKPEVRDDLELRFSRAEPFSGAQAADEADGSNYKTEFVAEIYRGGGPWLTEPAAAEAVAGYRELVRAAGEEVVTAGRLSEETRERLEQPLILSPDFLEFYRKGVNRYWDDLWGRQG